MSNPLATQRDLRVDCPARDGVVLRGRFWAGTDPRGILVLSPGLGEHVGCYQELAEKLAMTARLVDVVGFDFRGHGLSPGKRGVVGSYGELVTDLEAAFAWTARERPGRPVYLLGHSNGGQVALRAILRGSVDLAGLVLSNPTIRLAIPVPAWKVALGRFLLRYAPQVTLRSHATDEQMTRDRAAWPARQADSLRHSQISAPLYFGLIDGGAALLDRASEIQVPTLMILGEADTVVDVGAARAFFDRLGSADKTLCSYPDRLHEPLNDLGRDEVYADLISWLIAHIDSRSLSS
jgi:alpha-beta hydrolase superfamily lysophospholipase